MNFSPFPRFCRKGIFFSAITYVGSLVARLVHVLPLSHTIYFAGALPPQRTTVRYSTERQRDVPSIAIANSYGRYLSSLYRWELESDYYLHNFNVKSGISHSMRDFQIEFGVLEWNKEGENQMEVDRSTSVALSRHRSHPSNTALPVSDASRQEDQLRRIQKVRDRCYSQNKALSIWWKIALQSNVQQRMWMKLGNSPTEMTTASRFDRLYQPEKLAQFDRFFARPWSTPVRRSHSAQHSSEVDDDAEIGVFRRNISGSRRHRPDETPAEEKANIDPDSTPTTLEEFARTYGFSASTQVGAAREEDGTNFLHHYVGDLDTGSQRALQEYEEYVSPQDSNSSPFRMEALEEFKQALEPLSLGADDVTDIRLVSVTISWTTIRCGS